MLRYYPSTKQVEYPYFPLFFSPSDKQTLTVAKERSIRWNDGVVNTVNAVEFGVVTVYDNQYGYGKVLDDAVNALKKVFPQVLKSMKPIPHVDHCEFCGQSITYVAVVIGIDKRDNNKLSFHQIGCDCLGKIFGQRWFGFRSADSMKRELVKLARVRSRKEKYEKQYAREIVWLNRLPDFLLRRKQFLVDMKTLLMTGNRVMTKNMESYLHKLMVSKEFDPKTFDVVARTQSESIAKLEKLLDVIKQIDGENIRQSWSAHGFVSSILQRCRDYNCVPTVKQMDALNKVHSRYTKALNAKSNPTGQKMVEILTNAPTESMPW